MEEEEFDFCVWRGLKSGQIILNGFCMACSAICLGTKERELYLVS